MIIGFAQRRQTVSEGEVPGEDVFIDISTITLRASEIEHRILYRLLSIGTATVVPFTTFDTLDYDAQFGIEEGDHIEVLDSLEPGEIIISPQRVVIRNDFLPEDVECFSIRISPVENPGVRELFRCNEDDSTSVSFFCKHTVCIQDNDGKAISYQLFM